MTENIVLEGGGAKCIAYGGVLKALDELGINLRGWAGTSGGSIAAGLKVAGLSTEEILKALSVNMTSFFDDVWGGEILEFISDGRRLFSSHGVNSGIGLYNWLLDITHRMTLGDVDQHGYTFKAYAVRCWPGWGLVEFSSENPKQASVCLADVIRASCGIPLLLTPWLVMGEYYVDGGLVDNFPLHAFPPSGTLGFIIDEGKPTSQGPDNDLRGYIRGLLNFLLTEANRAPHNQAKRDMPNIIRIPSLGVSTVDFGMSQSMRERLIASGYDETMKALKR